MYILRSIKKFKYTYRRYIYNNISCSPSNSIYNNLRLNNKKKSNLFGDRGCICTECIGKKLKNEYNIELLAKSRKNMNNKQYDTLL